MTKQRWGLPWPGPEIGQEAEDAGAEAFCVGEFADHDAYVSLAGLADKTRDAKIGTAIAYAFTRSPWAHAASIRQIHQSAPGRVFLGLGAGTRRMNTDWFGTEFQPVLSRMEELIGATRAFLTAENMKTVRFEGEHYQIKAAIRAPVMGPIDVPILLGAFNRGMVGVAGRVADGVVGHGLFTDRYWDERIHPRLDQSATKAGRDPMRLMRWGWLITAIDDEDPKRASVDARRMIAFYLTVKTYDALVELHGWHEPVATIRAAFARGDTDAMAEAVSDEMLDAIAIHGTLEEARQRLAARTRLPELCLSSAPSFLVSGRRRALYSRGSIALFGKATS
jgi:alkanesulfonate monooxygenase SsuD/methylene tetrahydromethanopterin reductase-like flavin-dependent oxidoreductase (luciferase family)